jgi:hypothetical protein
MAVSLTFKGSDEGARATAEALAKSLDQLGLSADQVNIHMKNGKEGTDGLFGSMKDLRGEARQHERVFSYFGAQLASATGQSKGLATELVGLGVAMGSGMWMLAAVEGVKLILSHFREAGEEAKKAEKESGKYFQTLIEGAKEANVEIARLKLEALGLSPASVKSNMVSQAYQEQLDLVERMQASVDSAKGDVNPITGENGVASSSEVAKLKEATKVLDGLRHAMAEYQRVDEQARGDAGSKRDMEATLKRLEEKQKVDEKAARKAEAEGKRHADFMVGLEKEAADAAKVGVDEEEKARADLTVKLMELDRKKAEAHARGNQAEVAEVQKVEEAEVAAFERALAAIQTKSALALAKAANEQSKLNYVPGEGLDPKEEEKLNAQRRSDLAKKAKAETLENIRLAQQMGQSFGDAFGGMVAGTEDFSGAMRKMAAAVVAEVTKMVIQSITAKAADAAAGAADSQADIPVIGPILAISAMGAMLSAVMGMVGHVGHAAGGWQLPSIGGPFPALLHTEEKVLPAKQAKGLDRLIESGGQGAQVVHHHHYEIHAMDAQSFRQFARSNSRSFAEAIGLAARNGSPFESR